MPAVDNTAPPERSIEPPSVGLLAGLTWRSAAWIAALLSLACAPLLVLLLSEKPRGPGFWWDFSMGLGFGGLSLIGLQFALTARFRRASSPFGIDVIYVFHRYLAWIALGLVLSHFAILWTGYEEALGSLDPRVARWELTAGRAALVFFILAVVTSQWRKPLRLEYGLWRYAHVALATLGYGAATAHILGVGNYTSTPAKAAFWLAFTLFWLLLLLWVRVAKPFGQTRRPYRVVEVRKEAGGDACTLVLAPDGHDGLRRFKPGQFAWLTLKSSPYGLREHPFSIASPPEQLPTVEFGIKALGDFTKSIGDVAPGEAAYLDGPYGVFSVDDHPDAAGYVFVVGGIGVTPVMSMMRSLAARGDTRPLWLFYGNKQWNEVVYREEIEGLKDRLNLSVIHILEDAPADWRGETGFVNQDILARHLPADRSGLRCFLCGPAPMTAAAREGLSRLGIARTRIRTEIFELA